MRTRTVAFFVATLVAAGAWAYLYLAMRESRLGDFVKRTFWPVLYTVLLSTIAATFILGFSFNEWTKPWAKEGGLIEWTTFWLAVFAGMSFGYAAWQSRGERFNLLASGLSLLCVAIAGEEIAWGQHVFRFKPPDLFLEHNAQKEVTLHNIMVGGVKIGGAVQAFAPLVLVSAFFIWQRSFPKAAQAYAGFQFNARIALFVLIFAVYFMISSFPFQLRVEADVPLSRVPVEMFRRHSWTQVEPAECLLSFWLLVAAIALNHRYFSPEQQHLRSLS